MEGSSGFPPGARDGRRSTGGAPPDVRPTFTRRSPTYNGTKVHLNHGLAYSKSYRKPVPRELVAQMEIDR